MTKREVNMSILDAIYKRFSVRSYSSERLDQTTIRALARSCRARPHSRSARAVGVCDSALKRLSDRAKPLFLEEVQCAHLDRGGHALDIFASHLLD
jgi:nitroreductase